jgi:hypothetical protein
MAGLQFNKRLQQSKGKDGYNYARVDDNGAMLTAPQQGMTDAFGRLRVSQISTFLDLKQTHDKLPLFYDEKINGDATSTHSTLNAETVMATSSSGDYVVRASKQRANYSSGKSQQVFMTFGNLQPQTNIVKRVGYFTSSFDAPYIDSLDGIFLESSNGIVTANIYKRGTLTQSIEQNDWDDPMNGSGQSQVVIDWTKTQILMISYEWLGVGSVQISLVVDGVIYDVVKFKNANNLDKVYMSSPNQSLRYEIRQTGVGGGEFATICSSVGSEGSITEIGKILSDNSGITPIQAAATTTTYGVLGIRLQSAKVDTEIDIIDFNILCNTSTDLLWSLILNPTVAGTFTYNDVTNSAASIAKGVTADPSTNTITGGTVLASGYLKSGSGAFSGGSEVARIVNAVRLGVGLDGALDTFVLCVRPLQVNADVLASISWRERN